jgi:hypothetical protein
VRLEGLGQLKKIHLMGTRTRDLPACSIVPQPTTLPRAPVLCSRTLKHKLTIEIAVKVKRTFGYLSYLHR